LDEERAGSALEYVNRAQQLEAEFGEMRGQQPCAVY
jgi:hypothetical protein